MSLNTATDVIHEDRERLENNKEGDDMQHTDHQQSGTSQEPADAPIIGRLTCGNLYLELPIDAQHKANRKVLGVLGREMKDTTTGNPGFTF